MANVLVAYIYDQDYNNCHVINVDDVTGDFTIGCYYATAGSADLMIFQVVDAAGLFDITKDLVRNSPAGDYPSYPLISFLQEIAPGETVDIAGTDIANDLYNYYNTISDELTGTQGGILPDAPVISSVIAAKCVNSRVGRGCNR